ncbi:hypothetical protein ASG43_16990 [Aureimonas sp. Leaf454]|uniref:histidine phosphatase family protein n=1 Tax=Aureimonas sp. Leaf454 TaxID=1736381 RepID=UPI000701F454|nr:histidine phosphatase family protein [Aureimonas sp. Leaf454]KQT41979.1 hypothetical protein ASG43_16990 [Aureimonas sp. Leaf454]
MIEILLLRHAPTQWNAAKRIQGRTDVPLSAEGLERAAGWRLPAAAADWPVLSSPLGRAVRTAEAMGLGPAPFQPLIEMDWGRLEGLRLDEIRARGGTGFAANEALGLDFRPEGGESPREVGARALAGLSALDRDTVCVTHKGVLRALFARALDWDMRGKAPVTLRDGCCHRLVLREGGVLSLETPNIPLDAEAATRG